MRQKIKFVIDEAGFISLLLKDIYTRDDVYLRELVQNAIDSGATNLQLVLLSSVSRTEEIWGLYCVDNGRGMTRIEIEQDFLSLCKRSSIPGQSLYKRFGIGVFTYLLVAKTVDVITSATRGRSWHFGARRTRNGSRLRDIEVSRPQQIVPRSRGTAVLITFLAPKCETNVVSGLAHWIRCPLPATIKVLVSAMDPCSIKRLVKSPGKYLEKSERRYDFPTPSPESGVPIKPNHILRGGAVKARPGQTDLALTEGGILVETNCTDLVSDELRLVGFTGTVDVNLGRLRLDAGRGRATRDNVFENVISILRPYLESALIRYFNKRPLRAQEPWSSDQELLSKVLLSLPLDRATFVVRELDSSVYLPVLRPPGYQSLRSIGEQYKQKRVYIQTGQNWVWNISMGSLKGYATTIQIPKSDNARRLASAGVAVVVMPKQAPNIDLIPWPVLQRYFRSYHSVDTVDTDGLPSHSSTTEQLPQSWRDRLTLPPSLSGAHLSNDQVVILHNGVNAILNLDHPLVGMIFEWLDNNETVGASAKSLIEAYLNLISGKIEESVTSLERALKAAREVSRPRSPKVSVDDVIRDIENG